MAEFRVAKVEQGHTKIRNVPIAVTPEGFWCCPSPVMFQKTLKSQNSSNKPKPSSSPPKTSTEKKSNPISEKKTAPTPSRSRVLSEDQKTLSSDVSITNTSIVVERPVKPNSDNSRRKVAIEFGESGTSNLKVVLCGKQGFSVKLSVHRSVLMENSSFFAEQLSQNQSLNSSCLEIGDCDDVEIYVETIGLMYCKEMKQRLIKQNVARVLRVLKVFLDHHSFPFYYPYLLWDNI